MVTRYSNLSASAHAIFHLHVGRVHQEKTIESRHPTLLALRIIIRESAQVSIIYTLLNNKMSIFLKIEFLIREEDIGTIFTSSDIGVFIVRVLALEIH